MTPERKAALLSKMKAAVVSDIASTKRLPCRASIPLSTKSHAGLRGLRSAVKKYLKRVAGEVPAHMIDDAIQDVVVGVIRGDVTRGNVKKTALATLQRYRREECHFRFISLDDASNRLADRLDSLQFHF